MNNLFVKTAEAYLRINDGTSSLSILKSNLNTRSFLFLLVLVVFAILSCILFSSLIKKRKNTQKTFPRILILVGIILSGIIFILTILGIFLGIGLLLNPPF